MIFRGGRKTNDRFTKNRNHSFMPEGLHNNKSNNNKKINNNKKMIQQSNYLFLFSLDVGDLSEIIIFLITSIIAFQTSNSFYHFIATLPVNYSAAYATSRAIMALEMTARANTTFKLHRIVGILCLPYSLVSWYRIVILLPQEQETAKSTDNYYYYYHSYWFEVLDSILWRIALVCVIISIISGIFMLPHVSKRASILCKQGFGSGTLACIFSLLLFMVHICYVPFRVNGNQFQFVCFIMLVAITCMVGIFPLIMAIYTLIHLNELQETTTSTSSCNATRETRQEIVLKNNKQVQKRSKYVDDISNSSSSKQKRSKFQEFKLFFYDAFVDPNSVKTEETEQDKTPKWLMLANILIGFGIPMLTMVIICINYGLNDALPGISPLSFTSGNNKKYALRHRVATLMCDTNSIMNLSVFPAIMFDLTLLLLKKRSEKRIAMEILTVITCCTFLITALLPPAIFTAEEMQIQTDLTKALLYPLLLG